MANIYVTSDTHWGHKNIAGSSVSVWSGGYRTFDSVQEMDETLFTEINRVVGQDDILYFLGDLSFKGSKTAKSIRERINCSTIHFCLGNHDRQKSIEQAGFTSVQDVIRVTLEGKEFFMSHYAHRVWPNYHRGAYHLYGHSHNSLEGTEWGKSMDVGIDAYYHRYGYYRPFALEEIIDILSRREITKTDKHALV